MAKTIATRGDDLAEDYALTNPDGTAYDLTGTTLRWTLRRRVEDATALLAYASGADAELAIVDAANGLAELRVPGAATAGLPAIVPLRWDAEVTAADGTKKTLKSGTMTVLPDVTR